MSELSTTNEFSLDELFSKDPLSLTRSDRDKIVWYYRDKRKIFKQSEAVPKEKKKKEKLVVNLDEDL